MIAFRGMADVAAVVPTNTKIGGLWRMDGGRNGEEHMQK